MPDVCDVPVISTVCDKAGDAAASLVTAPFDWLAQAMGGAAGWMFESVWAVFDSTTRVDITSPQYTRVYNILFGVAVFVMLGFFMLQVIGGMNRREPAAPIASPARKMVRIAPAPGAARLIPTRRAA